VKESYPVDQEYLLQTLLLVPGFVPALNNFDRLSGEMASAETFMGVRPEICASEIERVESAGRAGRIEFGRERGLG
jgi:hypothetical protein